MNHFFGNQGRNALVLRMYSAYWGLVVLRVFSNRSTPDTRMMSAVIKTLPTTIQ